MGTGCGRLPKRMLRLVGSRSSTRRSRTSPLAAEWRRARIPSSASCGCASVNPDGPWPFAPRVGSMSTILWERAKRKNCRSTVSLRWRALGMVARNAARAWTSVRAQSCLLRVRVRKRARSRAMARAASMVLSVRVRVPALRARSRARSMDSANAWTCGRSGSGVASMRRWRRPAASRCAWSVGSVRPRWVKKPSRARARDPIDRPGRRARFSRAWGWLAYESSRSRPRALIMVQARLAQCRSAR